ncbi:CG11710 [Drosophila busckii]|uniref:CG11710 n=1 Tax=Drosophila busckii TaxID=30019 RepID=A0A0M4ESR5_DROBS|nr:activating signal cointegrator 1 [Drosophila busckii]ALC49402.1 CG11710 [Drosophila busckii]
MEKWLSEALSSCLDCVVTPEMMSAILAIKDDHDFDNYFGNLLSEDNEEHRIFLLNCRRMLLSGKQPRSKGKLTGSSPPTQRSAAPVGGATKKSGKYVNIYSNDGKLLGDTMLLKGRRKCDCQAAEHKLINNCMGCGRIVCEQEGSGACVCCGKLVYTNEEEQLMSKAQRSANSKTQGKLTKKQQQQQQMEKSQNDALAQRDRLLEYDRNSEKRTTVIDDELDYFQENSVWLSDAEREKFEQLKSELYELKHGSRTKRKIKVDFAGRELPEEHPVTKEYEQQLQRQLAAITKSAGIGSSITGHSAMRLPGNLDVAKPPVFKATKDLKSKTAAPNDDGLERVYNRVQDKELLEMQDMRQCLSMHQPWASMLVAGIKKHEGRVWYSEHRGRLWIASTTKEPRAEDISQLEEFYRVLYNDKNLKFPTSYPTSSLLGCVHVNNCLPQEEYRELYPNGESDSPYVFVCSKPEQLPLLLPVHGEHKIYELPLKTHNAACKTLMRSRANKG